MGNRLEETTPLLSGPRSSITSLTNSRDIEATEVVLDHNDHITDTATWKSESWLLLKYALPLIGTYLLQYFYSVVTIFVAGHIGADALAACSIGLTTLNIFGMAFFEGMATALDTLCAQAYGSGNLKGVGLHMQRMLCLMGLTMIPIGAVWVCSPWLLQYVVKQPHLAVKAGDFLRVCLIGLPGYAAFEAGKRFLQAQGNFTASLGVLLICAPINILLNWVFVFKLDWGLNGAALAQALTNDLRPVFLFAYILLFGRWSMNCWGGFSWDMFRNWGPMISLSLPCAAVNLSEWGAFELATFSTSWVSTDHLAAQTILYTVSIVVWHLPFSVSVAISTRIGHLIGAGNLKIARRVTTFYAIIFIGNALLDMAIVYFLREPLVRIFTEDSRVRQIAVDCMPVVAAFQVMDAILCFCNGTLRGLGRPDIGGWTVFLVNYIAAVPLALWLELGKPGLELKGVWIGLMTGMILSASIESIVMKTMDWQKCVDVARAREHVD